MPGFRILCDPGGWTRLDGSPYVTVSKPIATRSEADRRLALHNLGVCPGAARIIDDQGGTA